MLSITRTFIRAFYSRLLLATLVLLGLLLSGGCTPSQQDALFESLSSSVESWLSVETHTANVGDVEMTYFERQGDGPTVMLVHGFSADKNNWISMMPYVPSDWHVIIPDLAGHGDTTLPASGDYSLDKQVERLHTLMKTLDIPTFHLIGNSMGGAISALYATYHPEQITSLVLMDSAGVDAPNPSEFMQAVARGENPLIATDKDSFEYRWDYVMHSPMFLPWPLRPVVIRDTIKRADTFKDVFQDVLAARELTNSTEFLQMLKNNVTMPVLIMWGKEDRVLDVSAVPVFKRMLPHANVVVFEGVGHLPMLEDPKRTALAIADFIHPINEQTEQ